MSKVRQASSLMHSIATRVSIESISVYRRMDFQNPYGLSSNLAVCNMVVASVPFLLELGFHYTHSWGHRGHHTLFHLHHGNHTPSLHHVLHVFGFPGLFSCCTQQENF